MKSPEVQQATPPESIKRLIVANDGAIKSFTSYSGGAEMGWSLITPRGTYEDVPLLITTGYLGEEFAYIPAAVAALKAGKPTILTGQAKAQDLVQALRPAHLLHPERLQPQLVCRVIKDAASEEDIEQVDGVGHSKGGSAIIDAGIRFPNGFRSVTLWGSSGVSRHGLVSLLLKSPEVAGEVVGQRQQLFKNFEPFMYDGAKTFGSYVLGNSFRVATEGIAVSRSYRKDSLKWLSKMTCTGAMVFEDDPYFKPAEVARKIAGIVQIFKELRGMGHLGPQTHPDEVIEAQLEMLDEYQFTKNPKLAA